MGRSSGRSMSNGMTVKKGFLMVGALCEHVSDWDIQAWQKKTHMSSRYTVSSERDRRLLWLWKSMTCSSTSSVTAGSLPFLRGIGRGTGFFDSEGVSGALLDFSLVREEGTLLAFAA